VSKDIAYMNAALRLAEHGIGRTAPNPAVGCIIVKDAKVVAAAYTADGGRPHAETQALEKAGAEAKGATVYVTLEPCAHHGKTPPCAEALIKAGVKRVVVACEDPDPRVSGKGIQMMKDAGIEVESGVLEKEAQAMNVGFFLKVKEGRPFVTLKVATTQDDKIAPLKQKKRHVITGEMAQAHSHIMRSMHDAVLVGIGTVLKDDPLLTTRLIGLTHVITRVVMDAHLRIPLDSQLVKTAGEAPVWVFYKDDPEGKIAKLEKAGVKLFEGGDVHLVMKRLAEEGITRVLVEGGAEIHKAFAVAKLGDRLLWYRAPDVLGEGVLAFDGMEKDEILRAFSLKAMGTQPLDKDLLEIYGKEA